MRRTRVAEATTTRLAAPCDAVRKLAAPCDAVRKLAALVLGAALLLLAGWLVSPAVAGAAVNTTPPATPVKLIFIHHSTGEAWLADGHGGLGIALRDNNYFVSDTNYGWGPGEIGSTTDIGHWWTWFRDPATSPAAMTALFSESDRSRTSYSRLGTDPGGANQIVMFKSCFPNSQLRTPYTPIPAIADNPLKGQACGGADFTVANAKGIYVDLLGYFGAHPEKLFVAVVAPPVTSLTPGGRALANWLVDHWLQDAGYTTGNVFVFDYYTVLSSKTGGGSNDAGLATGNHHRVWNGAVQHISTEGADNLAYPTGDSHPSAAGDQKATAEFLPLLNAAYNAWKGNGDAPTPSPSPSPDPTPLPGALTVRAPYPATVKKGRTAALKFRANQAVLGGKADVTIRIRTKAGKCVKSLKVNDAPLNSLRSAKFRCTLKRGVYRFYVSAITDAGVKAGNVASNRLTVK